MVGYMRRYAGPYLKAKEILSESPMKTEYLRFRDIILEAPFFIGQTHPVFYPQDIPIEMIQESRTRRREQIDRAIGANATDRMRTTYQMMTPYVRYQPAYVQVTESNNHDTHTTTYGPDFHDAFQTELTLFAQCIKAGEQPKTSLEDAVADLKLFQEIIRVMAKQMK